MKTYRCSGDIPLFWEDSSYRQSVLLKTALSSTSTMIDMVMDGKIAPEDMYKKRMKILIDTIQDKYDYTLTEEECNIYFNV